MNNFVYHNPTKIHFGRGVVAQLADEVERLGASTVLLVYGQNSIKNNGLYDAVLEQLKAAAVKVIEHSGIQGNPVLSHARRGIELAREHGADLVLGVGGGSVVDEAKGIALGAASDCDVWDFFNKTEIPKKALPVIAVLTLPATGSEMNGIAVLTNDETHEKNALVCPGLLNPKASFMDPETTFSLSAIQTAYACTDILSHLMEAYLTTDAEHLFINDPVIEGVAHGVMHSMEVIMKDPENYDARASFMWSATMAWSGISQVGMPGWGMPNHALEMPMSGVYDIAHGAGLSIVIPAWIRVAGEKHKHRILKFGKKVLGLEHVSTLEGVADGLIEYYRSIGSPVTFKEGGIDDPDIGLLTNLAFDAFAQRGMTDYTRDRIEAVYKACV